MTKLDFLLIIVIGIHTQITTTSTCPAFDGRHQLRPSVSSREYLLLIQQQMLQSHLKFEKFLNTFDNSSIFKRCQTDDEIENRCEDSKYRTADGSCNNLHKPRYGKSLECLNRLLPAEYADGIERPKEYGVTGKPLPSPRLVSSIQHFNVAATGKYSHLLMQWGQFLDHDMSFTPTTELPEGVINCCESTNKNCLPISVPDDDPFYSQFDKKCISFVRSAPCYSCSKTRELINVLTAFIDASQVYGNSEKEAEELRKYDGSGKLKSYNSDGRELLPQSTTPNTDQCSDETHGLCFEAGDSRVNQLPSLTSMHTIFLRHHNRICDILKLKNPHWKEERLFQEARKIVGAQMQVITYKEFLPHVLGERVMRSHKLSISNCERTVYNDKLNPTIFTEFSTAAYRFGHTLVNGKFRKLNSKGEESSYFLRDNFFYPFPLYREYVIDDILRGLIAFNMWRFDPFVTDDLRDFLYRNRTDSYGGDLVAINIQRGRDHGLQKYTAYRKYCFNDDITKFEQLEGIMPRSSWKRYSKLYADVRDIDLYSAAISEYPMKGAIVGETVACVLALQFKHLKFGDRFWFQHGNQKASFTDGQLSELCKTTLAAVICKNGDYIPTIPRRVFEIHTGEHPGNPIVDCDSIPDLNLNFWKE